MTEIVKDYKNAKIMSPKTIKRKCGNLPLEEDKIMSGYFGFVAICVTQPLCPKRVPFNCSVSAIISQFDKIVEHQHVLVHNLQQKESEKISHLKTSYTGYPPCALSCISRYGQK